MERTRMISTTIGRAQLPVPSEACSRPSRSSPCLASRLPYGTAVTPERLAQIEQAERAVRAVGVRGEMRVRHHGDLARVELPAGDLEYWLAPPPARRRRGAVR